MGRYRPPQKRKSPYITREGWRALERELNWLWRVRRPEVTQAVQEAAAMGDRSENAEYIYGKKQLREIDRRVRYLSKRLDELQVVQATPADPSRVHFGAWITLENDDGERIRYRIVGPDEFNAEAGYISVDAPVARAVLGKTVDDEVTVPLPGGEAHYVIIDVQYSQ
ncbi:transcription elongation factor GreB [Aquisalimonas asiatica]|uniref:Transcription elongation factor GreB n=1 Tax=Aquisalimonas asiatica TaxID=406100 RepID=A0A1H8VGD2_9GAMM|nr:transcription elongation factor GreB [Aquisalimonas asiatica]SEP14390.1 transcription elongation factor GreB [Aquisalimonas asiatica]